VDANAALAPIIAAFFLLALATLAHSLPTTLNPKPLIPLRATDNLSQEPSALNPKHAWPPSSSSSSSSSLSLSSTVAELSLGFLPASRRGVEDEGFGRSV